ncbi:MAG TPA: enoyl-CoA hydratase/isomerase family protein [Dehalococcoidia bacterium]|nr:enoyl-CoA hydratase/isomerase family protein [Dehalococcoidia bacterium]
MKLETVIYEKKDNIAIIKLNRPQVLNAMNPQLVEDLIRALQAAKSDDGVRVVILTGEGRAFCVGEDLNVPGSMGTVEEWSRYIGRTQDIQRTILELGKPLIAAVRGYAVGGGCEFALSCDMRIASENAKFGFPEVSVGGTITTAGTKLIAQVVGLGRAKEMLLTAEFIDAQKAEQWGLVNKVVPDAELEKAALEMAEKIARNSPLAVRLTRKVTDQGLSTGFDEILEIEHRHIVECFAAGEIQRRMEARLAEIKKKK